MDYSEHYAKALGEPMKWFRLDADFMHDFKIRQLRAHGGYEAIGRYVALMSHLARTDGHIYDLSTPLGASFLAEDMGLSEAEVTSFATILASLGLIDSELWSESKKVCSKRLASEAMENAKSVARSRVKLDAMNEAKKAKEDASEGASKLRKRR